MSERPDPRVRRRRVVALFGSIIAVVLVYLTVVIAYGLSGDVDTAGSTGDAGPGDVILELTPTDVDAAGNRLSVRIEPTDLGSYSSDRITPDETLHLFVTNTDGPRTIEWAADEVAAPATTVLVTDGYVEQWPFDRYTTESVIVPVRVDADGEAVPISYQLSADGRVPGWAITARGDVVNTVDTADGPVDLIGVTFTATRAPSTIAFGIVLLTLMVVMPVLVLTAAFTVLRGKRKIEVTMLGWIGAMLFATIPLRNFLPGSPPIGSWVDYLIVLWVIAGLVAGLVVFVVAWLRDGPAGVAAADVEPSESPSTD
ncbi:DUF4436 domain-containing protein [Microbacterium sediminicola]|uniref:DUF4436 domain-containing protein n=1 Tax=Microbacterium sediminicola TaxID=415210 RepID=A0ABN2HIX0_9MICO